MVDEDLSLEAIAHDDESRTKPPANSLRVEERAEVPLVRSLTDLYEQRGFFENRVAEASWDGFRAIVCPAARC